MSVRRAGRRDLAAIAGLHNRCRPAEPPISEADVLASLAQAGFLILEDDGGNPTAAVAWRVENLVAAVLDIFSTMKQVNLHDALRMVEHEARLLQCEVIVLCDRVQDALPAEYLSEAGFSIESSARLPHPWREAVEQTGHAADRIALRRL